MRQYLTRRLLLFIPTLAVASILIFLLLRVMPGDVAVILLAGPSGDASYTLDDVIQLRERLGLNDPIYVQYMDWAWGMLRGDLGNSFVHEKPIWQTVSAQFPVSLELGIFTIVVIWMIAVPIGILAAIKQDGWLDYILRGIAITGLAMPSFFVGMLVIYGLSKGFNWIPPLGYVHLWNDPIKSLTQLVFPAVALGFSINGTLLRMTRTQLLEVLREDYVRTARSKGLTEKVVILRHSVRNALLPVITIAGTQLGLVFSGTIVIENIFNVPGIGRGILQAMFNRDLPMTQVYLTYFVFIALTANLIVDMMYAVLDPRIRFS
jgi:peptide/nickel transport system permease protein